MAAESAGAGLVDESFSGEKAAFGAHILNSRRPRRVCYSSPETGVTTKEAWRSECWRKGLMHFDPGGGTTRYTKSSQAQFNQYVSELVTAKWVGVNGEAVRNTRK